MGKAVCGSSQSPVQEVTSDIKFTDTIDVISNYLVNIQHVGGSDNNQKLLNNFL